MKRVLLPIAIICIVFSFLFSCKEEEPAVFHPNLMLIDRAEELFDADGSIKVTGLVGIGSMDSIETVGIVYTDGIEGNGGVDHRDPVVGTDHVAAITHMTLKEPEYYTYSFDVLINPDRKITPGETNTTSVFFALFIKTKAGKIYQESTENIREPKLGVLSIYPAYAKPGDDVVITLNRRLSEDGLLQAATNFGSGGKFAALDVQINDKSVHIESFNKTDAGYGVLTIKMPEGVNEETNLAVATEYYLVNAETKVKNTSRSFTFLTKSDRSYLYSPALFATAGAIYFGGGGKTDDNTKLASDFWKYTVSSNTWSTLADLPSNAPNSGGMSWNLTDRALFGQPTNFYQYDFGTNMWTSLSTPSGSIQYDHTFRNGTYVAYNNKIYFTHYYKELEVGGIFYHNFWEYNPANSTYTAKAGYPGKSYDEPYLEQAAMHDGLLHYFPGFEHWSYDPGTGEWKQYANVAEDNDQFRRKQFKTFSLNNELYGVYWTAVRVGYYDEHTIRLMKYNSADDTWTRDTDVPFDDEYNLSDLWVLNADDSNVYLVIKTRTTKFFRIE